jgi:hypothetical protein
MAKVKPPAPRPCGSCPYRKDVPSGVWHPKEYAKLLDYDKPTGEQPPGVFMCHQQDGCLCAGWVAVHDMHHSLAMRFALSMDRIEDKDIDAIFDYQTDVPLFASGREAAEHGLEKIADPDPKADRIIKTLTVKKRLQSIAKRLRKD